VNISQLTTFQDRNIKVKKEQAFHGEGSAAVTVCLQQVCFLILQVTDLKGETIGDRHKVFKMYHTKKVYYFQAESQDIVDK
jgi:hypothetical protein